MNSRPGDKNRRVPIIDDNPSIHADFRKILSPVRSEVAAFDASEAAPFRKSAAVAQQTQFEVYSAYQGEEGSQRVARYAKIGAA